MHDFHLQLRRSVILRQWRERRMRVIWTDLEASMTVRAREFWICWRRKIRLRLTELIVVERVAVIKFGVNDRGSNGTGSWRIAVRPDTAKLTNVIGLVTGFEERCNLVREGNMFVRDEAKISSREGVKRRIVHFGKLVFSQMSKNLVLKELRVRRLAVIQKEIRWKAFWRWEMLESKLSGWKEKSWVSSA